jgi:hypothetical protein
MCEVVAEEIRRGKRKQRRRLYPRRTCHLKEDSTSTRLAQATFRNHSVQLAPLSLTNMAKTYKQLKEAWVSGHTGSSVADVNSVSLAMPVPYTHPRLEHWTYTDIGI